MFELKVSMPREALSEVQDFLVESELFEWTILKPLPEKEAYFLVGYFADPEEGKASLEGICRSIKNIEPNSEIRPLSDTDWQNEYKKYIRPWHFEKLHWVPIWKRDEIALPKDATVVYFDAGMAFGTGSHETTQLCGQAIYAFCQKHNQDLQSVCMADVGCGSGILGITAKKLGVPSVTAFDIDPDVLKVCSENAAFNDIEDIEFFESDIEGGLNNQSFDLVVANILAPILMENRDALLRAVKPNGLLVLSGILKSESQDVVSVFNSENVSIRENGLGDWVALEIKKALD